MKNARRENSDLFRWVRFLARPFPFAVRAAHRRHFVPPRDLDLHEIPRRADPRLVLGGPGGEAVVVGSSSEPTFLCLPLNLAQHASPDLLVLVFFVLILVVVARIRVFDAQMVQHQPFRFRESRKRPGDLGSRVTVFPSQLRDRFQRRRVVGLLESRLRRVVIGEVSVCRFVHDEFQQTLALQPVVVGVLATVWVIEVAREVTDQGQDRSRIISVSEDEDPPPSPADPRRFQHGPVRERD